MAHRYCSFRLLVFVIVVILQEVVNGLLNRNMYNTYDIEDRCTERYVYTLNSTGLSSTLKLKAYKELDVLHTINCHFYVRPPYGYEVVIHLENFQLGYWTGTCMSAYLEISSSKSRTKRVCGKSPQGSSFYLKGEAHLYYDASYYLKNKGFTLVATAYKKGCFYSPLSFRCANGNCIWSGLERDGVNNCGDNSDEEIIIPTKPPTVIIDSIGSPSTFGVALPYVIGVAVVIFAIIIILTLRKHFCSERESTSNVQLRRPRNDVTATRRIPRLSLDTFSTLETRPNTSSSIATEHTPPPTYSFAMKGDSKNLPCAPPPPAPPSYIDTLSSDSKDKAPIRAAISLPPILETDRTGTDGDIVTSDDRPAPSAPSPPNDWI